MKNKEFKGFTEAERKERLKAIFIKDGLKEEVANAVMDGVDINLQYKILRIHSTKKLCQLLMLSNTLKDNVSTIGSGKVLYTDAEKGITFGSLTDDRDKNVKPVFDKDKINIVEIRNSISDTKKDTLSQQNIIVIYTPYTGERKPREKKSKK